MRCGARFIVPAGSSLPAAACTARNYKERRLTPAASALKARHNKICALLASSCRRLSSEKWDAEVMVGDLWLKLGEISYNEGGHGLPAYHHD
jgi:hypothetical protein